MQSRSVWIHHKQVNTKERKFIFWRLDPQKIPKHVTQLESGFPLFLSYEIPWFSPDFSLIS